MNIKILKSLIAKSFLLSAVKKQYFLQNIHIMPMAILEKLFVILVEENQVVKEVAAKSEDKLVTMWAEVKSNIGHEVTKKFSEKLKSDEAIKNQKALMACEKLLDDFI